MIMGKILGSIAGGRKLTADVLKEWYYYFFQCTECRRCSVYCPYGIDTAEISMAAREILDTVGVGQKYCNEIIGKAQTIGNNLGLPEKALINTLEDLEEDIEDDTGVKVRIPVNKKGADILLVTPSADFFAEPHIDGLIGYAKVFHAAGVSWTVSSYASEAANFAMFIGSQEQMKMLTDRVRKAAEDLGVKRIIFGECGHAWRVAYSFMNTLSGPFDFLDPDYPVPQHICEFTWDLIEALPKAYYYHVHDIPYEVYSKNELQPFYFFSDELKASNHTPAFQKREVYEFEGFNGPRALNGSTQEFKSTQSEQSVTRIIYDQRRTRNVKQSRAK